MGQSRYLRPDLECPFRFAKPSKSWNSALGVARLPRATPLPGTPSRQVRPALWSIPGPSRFSGASPGSQTIFMAVGRIQFSGENSPKSTMIHCASFSVDVVLRPSAARRRRLTSSERQRLPCSDSTPSKAFQQGVLPLCCPEQVTTSGSGVCASTMGYFGCRSRLAVPS